ncbi:DUF58 domain-containing protein [Thiobacter aerophilum]|uniref:DUF58 domain-containing protein n=1 Tax=Thiobacter aerophilum TaxID=3121275 RepID=A0ABV0EEF8_9BURK
MRGMALSARLAALMQPLSRETGPIALTARRIYILPTRHGVLFALFLLAMLVGAVNYALSLGFLLVFLLAGVALAAMLHTWRNLRDVVVSPLGATPAFAGGEAQFHFSLSAPSPRPALVLAAGSAAVRVDLATVTPVNLPVPAPCRGRLAAPRLTVSTSYPLGLFRAWAVLYPALTTLVYPRPLDHARPPPIPDTVNGACRRPLGEGRGDFAGLRPFVPGDSPRAVAWKMLARGGPLASKRFHGEADTTRALDWAHAPGDTETKLSWLARAVLDAEQAGVRYGLSLPGTRIPPGHGKAQRQACLAALALFGKADHG